MKSRYELSTYQEGSTRVDISHACFASLPAELRNNIYAETLQLTGPVILTYNAASQRFIIQDRPVVDGRTPLEALALLSNIDDYVRQEARSFFFARNVFELKTTQTLTADPDYVEAYAKLLGDIGDIGRRSLRNLRLTVSGDSKHNQPNHTTVTRLFDLLAECTNLQRLDLFLEVDCFYMDQRKGLDAYLTTNGAPITEPWPKALDSLGHLRNLVRLKLHVVFSSRWRSVDCHVRNSTSETVPQSFDERRDRDHRPVEEAIALTDQIKGSVRAALRHRGIRVDVLVTKPGTDNSNQI
ncbi:hypothetical protein J1614_001220 [Plenodomus biglobosus]|nr:hypothetical protein J1614_001220 [Plenodomus biglobosus]